MNRSQLLILVSLLVSSFIISSSTVNALETRKITPYIISGKDATKNAYPWMVSLQSKGAVAPFNKDGHFCGGSLITPKYVLTASHCVEGQSADNIEVRIGGHDLRSEATAGTKFLVKRILMHWNYDTTSINNDIALLELQKKANLPMIMPITKVEEGNVATGESLTVMGWGLTSENDEKLPNILQEADVPLADRSVCENAIRQHPNSTDQQNFKLSNEMLCAGNIEGGKDSCRGDSGGPLIVKQFGEYKQIGIVSWGIECGGANQFGVYARSASFETWIAQHLKHLSQKGIISLGYIPVERTFPLSLVIQNNAGSAETIFSQKVSNTSIATLQTKNCINKTVAAGEQCELNVNVKASKVEKFQFSLESSVNNQGNNVTLKTTISGSPLAKVSLDNNFAGTRAFYSGGGSAWKNISSETGVVRSGELNDKSNEPSVLQTVVKGPATVTFDWRYASKDSLEEDRADFAEVTLDNKILKDSSNKPLSPIGATWKSESVKIPAGEHLLSWLFEEGMKRNDDRHLLVRKVLITEQNGSTQSSTSGAAGGPSAQTPNPNARASSQGGGGGSDILIFSILAIVVLGSVKKSRR